MCYRRFDIKVKVLCEKSLERKNVMKLRYPKYYENFACIAGACEDTCCAGWEIDIDDKSYEYYMQVPGEFGERIRNSIKEYQLDDEDVYESHGFILKENRKCPFLNENNLCDMILALGEDAICDVCTYTPRNFLEYGNAREISISPSCAEAGRLIFGSSEKVTFVEKEIEEELDFEESEEDLEIAEAIRRARDTAIVILQNREKSIYQRICEFLYYAKEVQERLNQNAFDEIPLDNIEKIIEEKREQILSETEKNEISSFGYFKLRMESFEGLDSINEEWEHYLERLRKLFLEEGGEARYEDAFAKFKVYLKEENREYEMEQLMVYYAFLFLARCVDDLNFWGKAQFCVSSFLMIRDMQMERFCQNGEVYTKEDCVDIARIYAKEVEHSSENLEFLEDEFLFEEIYQCEALCEQVLPE